MFIHNNGDTPDKLIGVKSEKVGKVVIHADPKYIVVPHGIVVPPYTTVTLQPGGPYVSLHDVKKNESGRRGYGSRRVRSLRRQTRPPRGRRDQTTSGQDPALSR